MVGNCKGLEFTLAKSPGSGTPVVVLERGRDLTGTGCRSGVVTVEVDGLGTRLGPLGVTLPDGTIVWYVLTGSRSTTDFGARHLRRLILDLIKSNA